MMEIKQTDLHEMEMLLHQSAKGQHFLFDHRQVAQILRKPVDEMEFLSKQNIKRIQRLLKGLLSQKSFYQKQTYLNSLDQDNFELLVRVYFHIVDSAVTGPLKVIH